MNRSKFYLLVVAAMSIVSGAAAQIITTVAGICDSGALYNGDGTPATSVKIRPPLSVVTDNIDNFYFTEGNNYVVRKVNASGIISTIAGTNVSGYSGDGGPATDAQLKGPRNIAVDKLGNLYITDGLNFRVRKVDVTGIITTYAGNGSATISGDGGAATAAGIGNPIGLGVDPDGNVYISAESYIRKVDAVTGIITKVAGTGVNGNTGNGGLADTAQISNTGNFAIDEMGNIYFANSPHLIRKIDGGTGIISIIGGIDTTVGGYSGDGGPATDALFSSPFSVTIDSCGNLYIPGGGSNVIRVISAANGYVYTIAGIGTRGCGGDGGPATDAQFEEPVCAFLSKSSDLYIADHENVIIRKVTLPRCDSLVFPTSVMHVVGKPDAGMSAYPNPGTSDGGVQVEVYTSGTIPVPVVIATVPGRVVRTYTVMPNQSTPLYPHLPPGMYLIAADTENGRVVRKLVVR